MDSILHLKHYIFWQLTSSFILAFNFGYILYISFLYKVLLHQLFYSAFTSFYDLTFWLLSWFIFMQSPSSDFLRKPMYSFEVINQYISAKQLFKTSILCRKPCFLSNFGQISYFPYFKHFKKTMQWFI